MIMFNSFMTEADMITASVMKELMINDRISHQKLK